MEPAALSIRGEFKEQASERAYRAEHLPEFVRQARSSFLAAALVSPLFLFTDLRFYGHPHFFAAIFSRSTIEFASLLCLFAVTRTRTFLQYELVCVVWATLVIPSSAILVTPHTDIALLVTFILPVIFYLAIPVSFLTAIAFGAICSAAALSAYIFSAPPTATTVGLVAGMVMSNAVLALVLKQSKQLRRMQWAATCAERTANLKLLHHRDTLQQFLHSVPAPLVITARGTGKLIHANEAACQCLGASTAGELLPVDRYLDPGEREKLASTLAASGQVSDFETRIHLPCGTEKDVLLSITTVALAEVEAILTVFVDITERKEFEALMKRLAQTDALTGLPNRARFFSAAQEEIKRARRYNRPLSVFMIDIDFFKRINDTHGHELGDLALKAFAQLCRCWIRSQDMVARLGGEEFGLLLPETDGSSAVALADRLRAAVANMRVDHLDQPITISIGVSEVLPGESTVDAALSRADQALYRAKRSGRNLSVLYKTVQSIAPTAMCG